MNVFAEVDDFKRVKLNPNLSFKENYKLLVEKAKIAFSTPIYIENDLHIRDMARLTKLLYDSLSSYDRECNRLDDNSKLIYKTTIKRMEYIFKEILYIRINDRGLFNTLINYQSSIRILVAFRRPFSCSCAHISSCFVVGIKINLPFL